ncbi:MAG: cell envelope integrity protein TolA, partial [Gammaproteobacteria bacterium]|nr:cell envelope integrity protein TolA [Gammaproteobacteria bacterium]
MFSQKRHNPGRVRAIFYAVVVHALVIVLLVIGFRWTTQPEPDLKIVQATVISNAPAPKVEENKRAQEEAEATRKKAEAEKRQQADLKKKLEDEQQQRKDAERKKKELAEKQEKEQKRAAEMERKKEELHRQKSAEQSLQQQLAAEEKARQDAARAARAATEVDKYKALIRQRVSRSWSRPQGTSKGLKCVVSVRLTPSGEVLAASVVRSSGDSLFDRSVENAVYKSAPLPLPADPTLFDNFREI